MIDDVFDRRISDALAPMPGELSAAVDIMATIQRRRQRKPHGHVALAAVVVVVIAVVGGAGLALASALGLFGTEPTHVHVTQPGGSSQPANGNRVGQPYTTSLQNAEAIAGYPLLTLDAGTVQLVPCATDHHRRRATSFPNRGDEAVIPDRLHRQRHIGATRGRPRHPGIAVPVVGQRLCSVERPSDNSRRIPRDLGGY